MPETSSAATESGATEIVVAPVPYGRQLTVQAEADPAGIALVVIARDGTETALTWAELERSANQWGRVLASSGVVPGAMVALSVPNSVELVVGALAVWKVGGTPIPMRWDLPDWEQQRLLEVISPALIVSESNVKGLAEQAGAEDGTALPEVISPALSGICSSGSTGLPKIILNTAPAVWTPALRVPFIEQWAPVPQPQKILVPAPMYHTNGFATLSYLLSGDQLVVLEKFDAALVLDVIEKHRITNFTATPTMLSRIADIPGVENRDLSSVDWILQGAAVMPQSLLRRWFDLLEPGADRDGLRDDREPRVDCPAR